MIDTLPIALVSRLIEESLDAVLVIDEHGSIRYLNAAMQALSGYAPGEALGQPLSGLLPEPAHSGHQLLLRDFLGGAAQSDVLGKVHEFAIRHRTGETIPVELKAIDLDVLDSVRYFGAFMSDLRERRAAEARHAQLVAQLEREAMSDALTGLPNRRAFEAEAVHVAARAQRSASAASVGIADIDHFKKVNDEHGHPAGDAVLREVAKIIGQAARATDVVARIGGEEFGLLFPDATLELAFGVAERIRQAVADTPVTLPDGGQLRLTISIGLAPFDIDIAGALELADDVLYDAKHKGRNRVEQTQGSADRPT
jgi:diguanylate cyclase (GGDEF)-like protein/PAS domain S-box-containing protein